MGLTSTLLQPAYKQELQEAYGIQFNSLICLNNMPIKRYADYLLKKKEMDSYMQASIPDSHLRSSHSIRPMSR